MSDIIQLILTQFLDEAMIITGLCLVSIILVLIIFWLYNRRNFYKLQHQIPANLVKAYLDSIIQHSTSLKSSLFRGIEMNSDISSDPSVNDVVSTTFEKVNLNYEQGKNKEKMQQKHAEIASLKGQLANKEKIIQDLEELVKNQKKSQEQNDKENKSLKKKNKLLEEELANFKKSQSENQRPKQTTSDLQKKEGVQKQIEAKKKSESHSKEKVPSHSKTKQMNRKYEGEKSAEELLGEFEKMLR